MAPLPPSSTSRVWFDYVTSFSSGVEHTVQLRYNGADRTAALQQQKFAAFLTAVGAAQLNQGWRVIRVRTALAGEDFSLAQTIDSTVAAFAGTSTVSRPRHNEALEFTWQARSTSGPRRCDLSLYGWNDAQRAVNGRWTPGGSNPVWVGNSVAALNAAGSAFVAIDGTSILWYPYVNTGSNAYWKRRLRIS